MLSQAVGTPHISTTPSQHNKNSQHPTLLYSPPPQTPMEMKRCPQGTIIN